jgi:hypothetical protein
MSMPDKIFTTKGVYIGDQITDDERAAMTPLEVQFLAGIQVASRALVATEAALTAAEKTLHANLDTMHDAEQGFSTQSRLPACR